MPKRFGYSFKPWFLRISYWVGMLFLVLQPFFQESGQARLMGIFVLLVAASLQFNKRTVMWRLKKPLELKFYTWWTIWALLSGFFVAQYLEVLWFSWKTILQLTLLLWAYYAMFIRQRQDCAYYYCVIAVAIINCIAMTLGYNFDASIGTAVRDTMLDAATVRYSGMLGNSNGAGFVFLTGVWGCMMMLRSEKSGKFSAMVKFLLVLALIGWFSYYTINTGSRKSLLVLGVMLLGWLLWMIPGKVSVKSFLIGCVLFVGVAVISGSVIGYVMNDTLTGKRFNEFFEAGGGSVTGGMEENIRYTLYVDGFKFWIQNPIAGLGLDHFRVHHWTHLYSHSDYIEPLACTGLVGFILYQGFSFTILWRLVKLLFMRISPIEGYKVKGMILFVICQHYIIGIGAPHQTSILHLCIMLFIGVYSWRLLYENRTGRMLYGI